MSHKLSGRNKIWHFTVKSFRRRVSCENFIRYRFFDVFFLPLALVDDIISSKIQILLTEVKSNRHKARTGNDSFYLSFDARFKFMTKSMEHFLKSFSEGERSIRNADVCKSERRKRKIDNSELDESSEQTKTHRFSIVIELSALEWHTNACLDLCNDS